MDPLHIFLIFVAFVVVVFITYAIYWTRQEKKRAEDWQRVAQEHGFEYKEKDDSVIAKNKKLQLFVGREHHTKNVLTTKKDDINITVFDFGHRTGISTDKKTHYYTCILFQKNNLQLPSGGCYLRRKRRFTETFFQIIFGGKDLKFEEDVEFSDTYIFRCDDEAAAKKSFDRKVRWEFIQLKNKYYFFEGCQDRFVLYLAKRPAPQELPNILKDAHNITNLLVKDS